MKKSIITIAQTSQITWHPLTSTLYQHFIRCYDNDYIKQLSKIGERQYALIPQTIYLISTGKSQNKSKKGSVNSEVRNYQIVAGVFSPWFVENTIKHKKSQKTLIGLSSENDQSQQDFEQEVVKLIIGDFFNAVSSANMPYIAGSFFGINTIDCELAKRFFMDLMGRKLTAENYAKFFGITRNALYKQFEKSNITNNNPNNPINVVVN